MLIKLSGISRLRFAVVLSPLIVSVVATTPSLGALCKDLFISGLKVEGWTNQNSNIEDIRKSWDQFEFSNAAAIHPTNFRLIVRGLRDVLIDVQAVSEQIQTQELPIPFVANLVAESLPQTDSSWGLVLKLPSQHIVSTTPFDVGFAGFKKDSETLHFERYGLHTPAALLRESLRTARIQFSNPRKARADFDREFANDKLNGGSAKDEHNILPNNSNAIRFVGSRPGSRTDVVGLFVNPNSRLFDPSDVKRLQKIAIELGLQFVVLPKAR